MTVSAGPVDLDIRIWNCELFGALFDWFQASDINRLSWNNEAVFLEPEVDSIDPARVSYVETPDPNVRTQFFACACGLPLNEMSALGAKMTVAVFDGGFRKVMSELCLSLNGPSHSYHWSPVRPAGSGFRRRKFCGWRLMAV